MMSLLLSLFGGLVVCCWLIFVRQLFAFQCSPCLLIDVLFT